MSFVTVSEIVGDGRDALIAELFRRVFAKHVHRLCRGADRMKHKIIALLLREIILSGGSRCNERHPRLFDVIVDCQCFKRRQRADDHMHFAALDQLLRLGLRSDRVAAGVGDNEFDLPSRNRVATLLEKKLDSVFHLAPAGGERAGANREKTDAYGICLPLRQARRRGRDDRANDNW